MPFGIMICDGTSIFGTSSERSSPFVFAFAFCFADRLSLRPGLQGTRRCPQLPLHVAKNGHVHVGGPG